MAATLERRTIDPSEQPWRHMRLPVIRATRLQVRAKVVDVVVRREKEGSGTACRLKPARKALTDGR